MTAPDCYLEPAWARVDTPGNLASISVLRATTRELRADRLDRSWRYGGGLAWTKNGFVPGEQDRGHQGDGGVARS